MKTLKYIALSLLVAASTTACKDDPELLTTDVGPEMTVVSADASGVYGGKVDFEVTMTPALKQFHYQLTGYLPYQSSLLNL